MLPPNLGEHGLIGRHLQLMAFAVERLVTVNNGFKYQQNQNLQVILKGHNRTQSLFLHL